MTNHLDSIKEKWQEIVNSITNEEKLWIDANQKDELVIQIFELSDYITLYLPKGPDAGCLIILEQLLKKIRNKIENER